MVTLIYFLLIGLVAGWLAGQVVRRGGYGVLGDIVLGVLGAVVGGSVFEHFGLAYGGLLGSIVVATIGAVVLLVIARLIKRA